MIEHLWPRGGQCTPTSRPTLREREMLCSNKIKIECKKCIIGVLWLDVAVQKVTNYLNLKRGHETCGWGHLLGNLV